MSDKKHISVHIKEEGDKINFWLDLGEPDPDMDNLSDLQKVGVIVFGETKRVLTDLSSEMEAVKED